MSRNARREALLEQIRQNLGRLAESPWFKRTYAGKSLGEVMRIEGADFRFTRTPTSSEETTP